MQGDDSSNDESLSVPSDTTTPPGNQDNRAFAAELRDLELRLEQLELEQRSLRIQLQCARLRHTEHKQPRRHRQRHPHGHNSRPPVHPLHPDVP